MTAFASVTAFHMPFDVLLHVGRLAVVTGVTWKPPAITVPVTFSDEPVVQLAMLIVAPDPGCPGIEVSASGLDGVAPDTVGATSMVTLVTAPPETPSCQMPP